MIDFERGLYVVAYRVLGIYNPSESGECWLILSNTDDQLWYISQRHVRTFWLQPNATELREHLTNHFDSRELRVNRGLAATRRLRWWEQPIGSEA